MAQIINTNVLSLNAQRNLTNSQSSLQTSLQRLSSGLRINSAKDDAAGLAISERFTTQIRGTNQAIRNANDGISFAQTAEGALSTVGDALQRIRELAVQSANDTNSASDREALNNEVQQLIQEVNRVAFSTQFNGQNVLDGSLSNLVFQVGANQGQTITVNGVDARGSELGAAVGSGTGVLTGTSLTDIGVNGTSIDLSGLTTDDMSAIISRINAETSTTGVTAERATSVETTLTIAAGTAGTQSVTINGQTVSFTADGTTAATTADNLRDAINSAGLGIVASTTGADLTLSSSSNISVADDTDDVFADAAEGTYAAGITFSAELGTASVAVTGTDVANLGLAASVSLTDRDLNSVNVSDREAANNALVAVDFALQQIGGLRAELGAVQVRFENTISNLGVSVENLSAARSRIRDADFAAETAELTRAQILQQAGISVLAQANAVPQSVLALLQ
ncbi:flagellin [Thioalkalivibrio sulfidiphilus]|uniref:flagellin N-terminal helical domain-containing protein n=1 Tax=Thioalkalivibrio sulfidiphilus TaxID=1033854 RepID=UPI003B31E687